MGFTHYLKQTRAFTDNQWKAFIEDVKDIFKNSEVPLANFAGEEGTQPLITDINVSFNGVGDDAHETCMITKRADKFSFCKTAQKPYDCVVVEVMKAARKHNHSIELSSDGGPEVFDDPEPRTVMGYPMD
jgi:hypothetical protein